MNENALRICSLNCQGLGDFRKRRDVLNYLRDYSVLCLQDTHISKERQNQVKNEWGSPAYFSSYSSNTRGVAILINSKVEHNVKSTFSDFSGNYLFLDIEIFGLRMTLGSVYAPNKDEPMFFGNLKSEITNIGNQNIIIVGDWNVLINPNQDGWNYKHINNPKARETLLEMMSECNLMDIWRDLNPQVLKYTWKKKFNNKIVQRGRLDAFLISNSIANFVKKSEILPGYRSDHNIINIKLENGDTSKRNTFWKFNNSLLKNAKFLEKINNKITEVKERYAAPVYNTDKVAEIENRYYQSYLDPNLFLEVLLLEIRGECLRFSAQVKKQDKSKELRIRKRIEELHAEDNKDNIEKEELERELNEIREKRLEGTLTRARARWMYEGEKPTKYFLNLESRNYVSKTFRSITVDGKEIDSGEEIMEQVKLFYQNLYESKDSTIQEVNLDELLGDSVPKISEDKSKLLQGKITLEEAGEVLRNFSNNKSPGTSGFTSEFYKVFWVQLGHFLVSSMNYSFFIEKLPITQRQGIITCIPKPGKDKKLISNWRPISLLNVSYKILSGVLSKRMRKILPYIISKNQSGFMNDRFIGDNIRLVYDTLHHAKVTNKRGLLLLIDFEKAFDSISWKFMNECLRYFKFPEDFIKWINVCYKDGQSTVNVNSRMSRWFDIKRGCRQGDPLSPYVFLICAEILSIMIQQNKRIKGYKVNDVEVLISQYADDTVIFMDGNKDSFSYCVQTLLEYAKFSGLNMNFQKTKVVWFGCTNTPELKYMESLNLQWNPNSFNILGIEFKTDLRDITDLNIGKHLHSMETTMTNWSNRNLTPVGKITVIKSLIISKIVHIITALPSPSKKMITTINKLLYGFIWRKGPDLIKRETICQPKLEGGLAMIDLDKFINALKLTWLRKLNDNNHPKWKEIIHTKCTNIINMHRFGSEYTNKIKTSLKNEFWTEVLDAYIMFFDKMENNSPEAFNETLFMYNKNFQIGNKTIHFRELVKFNLFQIKGFKNNNNNTYLSYREFKTKYIGITLNYLEYMSLIRCFKRREQSVNTNKVGRPGNIDTPWSLINKHKKGARLIYQCLLKKNNTPTGIRKWQQNELGNDVNWRDLFQNLHSTTKDSKLVWFQYRVLHNILTTNRSVSKYRPQQSELCQFCKNYPEYISHILFACSYATQFWEQVARLLNSRCPHINNCQFSLKSILFGAIEKGNTPDNVFNTIILLGKYYLYKCKVKDNLPQINHFINEIHKVYTVQTIEYSDAGLNRNCIAEWMNYKNLFRGLRQEINATDS